MLLARRSARTLVALAAATVVLATAPLVGVASAATPPPAQDTAVFCRTVSDDTQMTDVPPGPPHRANILCLSVAGITQGTTSTTYSPDQIVTRAQMATFIARSIDEANELAYPGLFDPTDLPPYDGSNQFSDVADDDTHVAGINRLADAGIVQGPGGGTYDPGAPVTRAQMASFINRAEDFTFGEPFSTTDDYFTDDNGSTHEANINGIASEGIASGVSAETYAPSQGVTRAQMASFIIRWLAVENERGNIDSVHGDPPDLQSVTGDDADGDGELSEGDVVVLTFAKAVEPTGTELILEDADGTTVSLTDEGGPTEAVYVHSATEEMLTITVTGPVTATGGDGVLSGTITITGHDGIIDEQSSEDWVPADEDPADVTFELSA
jgi:hypothetical protein